MKAVEYLVNLLKTYGVKDVFGVPGGVVLDFLYELDIQDGIMPHLSYHEGNAAFEAIGYAQVNHTLGVAYSTKGPGFTNMITGIAEAYAESIPVLFITSHSSTNKSNKRFIVDQELDTSSITKTITKYSISIDDIKDFSYEVNKAISISLNGRKGPVLIDVLNSLWKTKIDEFNFETATQNKNCYLPDRIIGNLNNSKYPIFLIGDGINQVNLKKEYVSFFNRYNIPVLSSRGSQNIGASCDNYFGYIGSHGMRYSNYIFDKADYVLSIGNRMSFPHDSQTFKQSFINKVIDYIDVDDNEFEDNTFNYNFHKIDIEDIDLNYNYQINIFNDWLIKCRRIKNTFMSINYNLFVDDLINIFKKLDNTYSIVCDVGNNEFLASQAYELSGIKNEIYYSKSYGTLGCSIAKSTGVYYKTRKPVLCIIGDQGLQFGVQELQSIASNHLPIKILVLNNKSSGMILDHEKKYGYPIHTTNNSGYASLNIKLLANLYSISYVGILDFNSKDSQISELLISDITLTPYIPKGNKMYDMEPKLNKALYEKLEDIIND